MNLKGIKLLREKKIHKGELWLYSADFNTKDRVKEEVEDIKYISRNGGIVVILAHQGRYKDGSAESLRWSSQELTKLLGKKVHFFEESIGKSVSRRIEKLGEGEIAVLENTRINKGEEEDGSGLARKFVDLVKEKERESYVAIGGFGKAHRKNASNYGILNYLPGFLAESQVREMGSLGAWSGKSSAYSIAVLGGVKKEKITEGLVGFSESYDFIIPGGIVLNTIYYVQGRKVGDSVIEDEGKISDKEVKSVLRKHKDKIAIPEEVIIAKKSSSGYSSGRRIFIEEGVPKGWMIVDFILSESARESLEQLVRKKGRIVMAGTPGLYKAGFKSATDEILKYMNKSGVKGLVLGGDTAQEVKYKGNVSLGGGASLYLISHGTTPVLEKLRSQKL